MEQLSWFPKFLAELGYKLFSSKREEVQSRKLRFADLVYRIAECIEEIGNAISGGVHPTGQCAELSLYLKEIQNLAAEITDAETAEKLMFWLYHVECVPGVAKVDLEKELRSGTKPPWSKAKRHSQSSKILEISGTLKAIANLLKV